jgi:hypothetical protein
MTASQGFRGALANLVIIGGSGGRLLVYDGIPAFGNLILAISATGGTDPYGNTYDPGIGLAPIVNPGDPGELLFTINNAASTAGLFDQKGPPEKLILQGPVSGNSLTLLDDASVVFGGQGVHIISALVDLLLEASGTGNVKLKGNAQLNAGHAGKYLNIEATFSIATVSGIAKLINALTVVNSDTDYAGTIAAGVFSAPVDGWYSAFLHANDITNNATRSSVAILRNGTVIGRNDDSTNAGFGTGQGLSTSVDNVWLNAGDTLQGQLFQVSGGNLTVTGFMTFRREP